MGSIPNKLKNNPYLDILTIVDLLYGTFSDKQDMYDFILCSLDHLNQVKDETSVDFLKNCTVSEYEFHGHRHKINLGFQVLIDETSKISSIATNPGLFTEMFLKSKDDTIYISDNDYIEVFSAVLGIILTDYFLLEQDFVKLAKKGASRRLESGNVFVDVIQDLVLFQSENQKLGFKNISMDHQLIYAYAKRFAIYGLYAQGTFTPDGQVNYENIKFQDNFWHKISISTIPKYIKTEKIFQIVDFERQTKAKLIAIDFAKTYDERLNEKVLAELSKWVHSPDFKVISDYNKLVEKLI